MTGDEDDVDLLLAPLLHATYARLSRNVDDVLVAAHAANDRALSAERRLVAKRFLLVCLLALPEGGPAELPFTLTFRERVFVNEMRELVKTVGLFQDVRAFVQAAVSRFHRS